MNVDLRKICICLKSWNFTLITQIIFQSLHIYSIYIFLEEWVCIHTINCHVFNTNTIIIINHIFFSALQKSHKQIPKWQKLCTTTHNDDKIFHLIFSTLFCIYIKLNGMEHQLINIITSCPIISATISICCQMTKYTTWLSIYNTIIMLFHQCTFPLFLQKLHENLTCSSTLEMTNLVQFLTTWGKNTLYIINRLSTWPRQNIHHQHDQIRSSGTLKA